MIVAGRSGLETIVLGVVRRVFPKIIDSPGTADRKDVSSHHRSLGNWTLRPVWFGGSKLLAPFPVYVEFSNFEELCDKAV